MTKVKIETEKNKEIIDITQKIDAVLNKLKLESGICYAFVAHTTCALTTADLDPGTDKDFLDAIKSMFPQGNYRHPHDPSHVGDHIMSSIIGQSVSIPIQSHKLLLGAWQRVVLVELNGPKERNIVLQFQKI